MSLPLFRYDTWKPTKRDLDPTRDPRPTCGRRIKNKRKKRNEPSTLNPLSLVPFMVEAIERERRRLRQEHAAYLRRRERAARHLTEKTMAALAHDQARLAALYQRRRRRNNEKPPDEQR